MKSTITKTLLGLVTLLGPAACKAAPSQSHAHSPDEYGGATAAAGASYEYEAVEDTPAPSMDMDVDMAPAEPPARERRALFERRRDRVARSEMAAPTSPQSDGAASSPVTQTAEPEKAIEQRDPDVDARHIVYTAELRIAVFNLEDAMRKAEALPETHGGYISSMQTGHLVLRIPSKQLRPVMSELAGYGNVEHRSLNAMDVTAEFTDIESRIRALEETQKQLLELLSQSRSVSEALQVRQALDGITTELEVLKGRMRQLGNQISFSTLNVSLYERGPHNPVPSSNDPFPWVDDLGVEATEWK